MTIYFVERIINSTMSVTPLQMDRHIVIYTFLPFLWTALYNCIDLPHPTCSYSDTASEGIVTYRSNSVVCYKVDLDIPNNFNVNLLPEDVQKLTLDCPLSMPYGYDDDDYCNTLRQSCTPLAFRPRLGTVKLAGFQTDHGRLPVGKFLENIKIRLNGLYIHSSRLGSLDADFLRGFQNLTFLSVKGNDIETLDVDTFQSLVPPSNQAIGYTTEQKLGYIVLQQNKLQQLDWSVFRPLADCLETVYLDHQRPGLKTLNLTGPSFSLTKFQTVDVSYNKLTTMPREILQTIPIHPRFTISMEHNNMCSMEDCSCCELREFMRWGQNYLTTAQNMTEYHAGVYFRFTCGGMYRHNPPEYTMDLYRNCPPS